jgi:hypothetical protein
MSELTETLRRLLWRSRHEGDQLFEVVGEDLLVKVFAHGVINIDGRGRELRREDVDAVRAALKEIGYVEVKSWVATQGASWLSSGLSAGVSFEVESLDELWGEAIREKWARERVAQAGHSWSTHMAKFDGTVLPR